MQKKTINNIAKKNYRKQVSIQLSLDGFCFCISNIATKELHHLSDYRFSKFAKTPELLLKEIEQLVADNTLLQQEFEQVLVVHQNNLATLVPNALFNKEHTNQYLKYNVKILSNDYIAVDDLLQADIKNVYIPYVNINNFFFQKFGEFDYKHHATVLIDKLILHAKNTTEKQFYVHVQQTAIDIVIIQHATLIFYNTFSYNTPEDFVYYILFVTEQLQLNPETVLLTFLGAIDANSNLYKMTYQYIRNIELLAVQNIFFDKNNADAAHTYYLITP